MLINPALLIAAALLAVPLSASNSAPAVPLGFAPAVAKLSSKKVEPKVVTFKTEDGLTLTANYFAPSKSKKGRVSRTPAAILVHDAGGNREQMTLFAENIHKQGLAVLAIDVRGHGASVSEKINWAESSEKERERMWSFAPRDLEAATKWLEGRKEVHNTNISLVGLRAGCSLTVYHAGRDSNIRSVVLIEPAANPELGFNITREMARLGGLATKVYTPREKEDDAVAIQMDATKANNGLEFVEIDLCKSKGKDLIHDRRVASSAAKWLKDIAFPKRGKRR